LVIDLRVAEVSNFAGKPATNLAVGVRSKLEVLPILTIQPPSVNLPA
jgi:hypothetical protein